MRSKKETIDEIQAEIAKQGDGEKLSASVILMLSAAVDVLFDLREQNERLIRQNDTIIKRLEEMPSKPRINPPF